MNYYNEIRSELINNEIYKKVKDYSKNRSDLNTYYNVGKLLSEAGKHYGEGVIREYSIKLTSELGKKYSHTNLRYMRQFYIFKEKYHTVCDKLSWSHYRLLIWFNDINKINYYINEAVDHCLSVRQLASKIKSNEYERIDENTRQKLINNEKLNVQDLVKNPIVIKNNTNVDIINEKILKNLILENISDFLKELGDGFSFIDSEYKIKIGEMYNYIDLLLFNYVYNSFVVVELKITELKKEHIGQIQVYMNYIDSNVRKINQDKTIGIIIVKKGNKFILEYSSDKRIYETVYILK